jgi:hypothetical protein
LETPRARFRAFLDSGRRRWILPALAGAGLASMATNVVVAFTEDEAKVLAANVPVASWYFFLLLSPALTVAGAALNALLLRWTGRWLGGQSTVRGLLTAIAWSLMPVALTSPLVAAEAIALLRGATSPEQAGGMAAVAERVSSSLYIVASVMAIFRLVVSVSEAQRFSKIKAAGNFLLASLPLLVLFLALIAAAPH